MDVTKFGLGARFDLLYHEPDAVDVQQLWDKVFSCIDISDAAGSRFSGTGRS